MDTEGVLDNDMHDPDFINSQAIYARVLVQTLAYPVIKPAIADLFDDSPGSADLRIARAAAYAPLGETMTFGLIQELVLLHPNERSICIGVIHSTGEVEVLPKHENFFTFEEKDKLIIIKRLYKDTAEWTAQEDAYGTTHVALETRSVKSLVKKHSEGDQATKSAVVPFDNEFISSLNDVDDPLDSWQNEHYPQDS